MLCVELMLCNNKTEIHMNYTIAKNKTFPITKLQGTERKIIVLIG